MPVLELPTDRLELGVKLPFRLFQPLQAGPER